MVSKCRCSTKMAKAMEPESKERSIFSKTLEVMLIIVGSHKIKATMVVEVNISSSVKAMVQAMMKKVDSIQIRVLLKQLIKIME